MARTKLKKRKKREGAYRPGTTSGRRSTRRENNPEGAGLRICVGPRGCLSTWEYQL